MCFILECWTGLKLKCVAPKLSHKSFGEAEREKLSLAKSARSHNVSDATFASALYSASVDDRATTRCFFELQEMGLEPRKHMYAEVDFRSSKLPAQSTSEYVVRLEVELLQM